MFEGYVNLVMGCGMFVVDSVLDEIVGVLFDVGVGLVVVMLFVWWLFVCGMWFVEGVGVLKC